MSESETSSTTQRSDVVAVHCLRGQRVPTFTVSCGADTLAAVACAALPEARQLLQSGRGLALRPTAISPVHSTPVLR